MKALRSAMVACALLAGTAHAQGDRDVAAEAFRAGESAYARRDYVTAARSFEAAHRLAPHPFASYNAGLAWQAAKDLPRAADAFAVALATEGLEPAQRADADKRLATLRRSLGRLLVTGAAGTTVSLAHAQQRPTPTEIHLPPGSYVLEVVTSDGAATKRDVRLVAGAAVDVDIPAPAPPIVAPPPPPPPPDGGGPSGHVVAGILVLVGAAGAAGAAVGTGVAALDARDAFDASFHLDAGARDRAATLRTAANVCWAAAGALAVTGVVVIATAPDWGGASVAVGPGSASVALRF
jgi:hypothetical protein